MMLNCKEKNKSGSYYFKDQYMAEYKASTDW